MRYVLHSLATTPVTTAAITLLNIVNPVTVFMLIVGIRFLKELAKRKEYRAGWKELFEI